MFCLNCGKQNIIKNGKINESQKYKCKDCNCQFKIETKIPIQTKNKSIVLYNLGFSIPKISQLMKTSSVNVLNWLKKDVDLTKKDKKETSLLVEPVSNKEGNSGIVFEIELDEEID